MKISEEMLLTASLALDTLPYDKKPVYRSDAIRIYLEAVLPLIEKEIRAECAEACDEAADNLGSEARAYGDTDTNYIKGFLYGVKRASERISNAILPSKSEDKT